MELSRLYGVSVDVLLSLEEAEKAETGPDAPTDAPAPAQPSLGASEPKKTLRLKLLLGAAAVCLALAVGLALYNNHRVKQLEWQVGSLQSQIMSVQSSLSSQIAGISSSVREAMEESATLTAQFDYTVKRFDLDAYTCTVAFALRPKTVQDGLAVSLRLRSLASDDGTAAVELVRDEYDVYRGEAVLSMNDNGFEAVAAYDTAVGRGDGGMLPVIPVAVDQRHVRLQGQAVDSHLHGLHSGRKDIRGVDLRSADTGYRPGQRRFRDDAVQGFPLLLRQLFRVVQAVDDALTGQNHRRRVHRAHQRPGAGLVHAADRLAALRPRFLFICPKLHGRSFQ
mgnify:CR=1 FL=1